VSTLNIDDLLIKAANHASIEQTSVHIKFLMIDEIIILKGSENVSGFPNSWPGISRAS
jgi:hypothetical protein